MKEKPIKLTDDHIAAVLELGSKNRDPATISEDALADLFRLGIVDRRTDGTIDFTDMGEKVYAVLFRHAA